MRSPKIAPFFGIFTAAALALSPGRGFAQSASDIEAAERAFNEALALMDAGRYSEACPKLETSDRLAPGSGTLLNLADCYEHLNRIGSAYRAFEGAQARANQNGKRERERVARERAALLLPRLSRLVLVAPADAPSGFSVALDGGTLPATAWSMPLVVDAGTHVLDARAPGRRAVSLSLPPLSEGQTISVEVPSLAHEASSPDGSPGASSFDAQRIAALVSAGVGLTGIVAGTAFGLHAMAKHDDSDDYCTGNTCSDVRGVSAMQDARRAGDRSTASFIVGGLGLAAASVLWFVRPFSGSALGEAQLGVGAGGVAVRGRF